MSYKQLALHLEQHPEFVAVDQSIGVNIDLKYADIDNFLGEIIYHDFNTAYLHRIAYQKLLIAIDLLCGKSNLRLKIFDCTRPPGAQRFMWDKLHGREEQRYLADPDKGSIHSFGFALDLTLTDGEYELDMGTPFDAFTPLSEPRREQEFLQRGELSPHQLDNRLLLRDVMHRAGFSVLPIEWWHFDALPPSEVRRHYRPVAAPSTTS